LDTGTVVLGKRDPRIFAIHSATGGVENLANAVYAHAFENVLGEIGAFPEIDVRLGDRSCNVRVGREMKHGVAADHGGGHSPHVFQIRFCYFNARVVRAFLNVGSLPEVKLSKITTRSVSLSFNKEATKWLPMKPAPPETKTCFHPW